MLTTNQVRRKFLDFFKSKEHKIIPSDLLVPKNDPSVLFTSAGMNQFKEQFLGKITDFRRAASSQKCLRTGDLEKVGHTPSHHTFFEMLGNFSFGDYFKKEAIVWAWEFLTQELKINPERLWVSVYEDDKVAYDIWSEDIAITQNKIYKFGQDNNFWPANAIQNGPNGPCGPCSEIFFDWGEGMGCGKPNCSPACNCGRFVEIWNLVFTQFNRLDGGKLEPLPNKNIDTGMGLERMVACLQGVKTNFEIDIFSPIVEQIEKILNVKPKTHRERVNCIADHIRAIVFAIGDGVLPSNENRGYVVRKLIRKASWLAQEIDYKNPFLYKLVAKVAQVMQEPYPELMIRRDNISGIILSEEERFFKNIHEGGNFLKDIINELKSKNLNKISGQTIFKLYDTYGFPLELTEIFAKNNKMELDLAGFNQQMSKQRQTSRTESNLATNIFSKDMLDLFPTHFIGYETTKSECEIIQLIKAKNNVETVKAGEDAWLILDKTPFYGESGGQIGDTGKIVSLDNKSILDVLDTKQIGGSIVQIVRVRKGQFRIKDGVIAEVDYKRRQAIRRSHTCTHLLQACLRRVLGQHVQQAGSLVEPDRFRFDFTHFQDVKDEELKRVQDLVNEYIRNNIKVEVDIKEKEEALRSGAIALFGEKYAERVRVVSMGEYSKEFCGGTHLDYTGDIGVMIIDRESSIGSGLRRIEGYTGKLAYEILVNNFQEVKNLSALLRAKDNRVFQAIELIIKQNKKLEKEIKSLREKIVSSQIDGIIKKAKKQINDNNYIIYHFKDLELDVFRRVSDLLINKLSKKSILFLSSEKGLFICRVTKDLEEQISAKQILLETLKEVGGSGGGRDNFAQGGLKDINKIKSALIKAEQVIKSKFLK